MSTHQPPRPEIPPELTPAGGIAASDPARVAAAAHAAKSDHDALSFAVQAARICADNRTEDLTVIDLRGLSSVADFFVIGTGTSDRQMRAALEQVQQFARTIGRKAYRVSETDRTWTLADYVDVIVHLFDSSHRSYYDLDGLWGDAPRIEWQQPPAAEQPGA